ncbi:MAG: response regulator [Solobacterium sp.]|jgi:two-component system response regulator YesN|nr:response regulator [Solobacterium sp.]MCH4206085.1 response regulator [Solobacterium sp.]MCH4227551.1 response regulator [Solobacterium sp.]MCH4282975.1 response regulator [Solobacterium sp.]
MYKILIADDEGIVCDSLKYIINKDFGSTCELFFAKSGRQAIETAEQNQPDIAFIDIKMPGINGLSALQEMKRKNPSMRALILTAYDSFDYAKKAILLGAVDYLTKPIDRQKITDCLVKIMHEIDEERRKRNDDLAIKERMETAAPIIENGFVLALITRNEYAYSGEQYRSLLGIKEDKGFMIVLEWDQQFNEKQPENPIDASVKGQKLASKMSSNIKMYMRAYLSPIMGNKIFCAVPYEMTDMTYDDRLRIIEKVRVLVESLKKETGNDFKAGIGAVHYWESMYDSYLEAVNALHHGVRSISHIDDLIVPDDSSRQQDSIKRMVLDAAARGNAEDVRTEANAYTAWLYQDSSLSLDDIKVELMELITEAGRKVIEQGIPVSKEPEHALLKAESKKELFKIFTDGLEEICTQTIAKDAQSDTAVSKVKKYLDEHYNQDISLDWVSEHVNISPYYFSKLFKQEMGCGFNNYLTRIRMEKAKRLLEDTQMPIKEVCAEVGYSDPNYFSRLFKRWTGLAPTELRGALQQ